MKAITSYINESNKKSQDKKVDKDTLLKATKKLQGVLDKMNLEDEEKEAALLYIDLEPAEILKMSEEELEEYLYVFNM